MSQHEIIVLKRKVKNNAAAAGGAWKVAFADFTLAMMAFFMVMWIIAVSSQEERVITASALRDYSILGKEKNPFDIRNSPYPVDLGGDPSIKEEEIPSFNDGKHADPKFRSYPRSIFYEGSNGNDYGDLMTGKVDGPEQMQELANFIAKLSEMVDAKDNLELNLVPQGLRILIRDDDEREMYSRGSDRISPFFRNVLMSLAPVFKRVENRIMISGHTDSAPFPGANYTNWELSSDRAMMARRVLIAGGMPDSRVAQVVGLADTMLDDRENSLASTNRRIELLVMTVQAESQLNSLFDSNIEQRGVSVDDLQRGDDATTNLIEGNDESN